MIPHTQEALKTMGIAEGMIYDIAYVNKDYFNGEETVEKGRAKAVVTDSGIFFNVTDPYGMEKLVMKVRVL